MGLVSKLKNILFEEEEVEIPVIEKKEKKQPEIVREYKELPKKEEVKVTNYQNYQDLEPVIREEKRMEENTRYNSSSESVSEREIFKSEKTFNFPAFDEEEFEHFVPQKRTTNVMEHERKKIEKKAEYKPDYRNDYKRPEEPKEVKKFKPSPIISPVYGILDKNYTPDEITTRSEVMPTRSLDVDTVRRKAFGAKEEKNIEKIDIQEEEVIVDKTLAEKLEKARTIDELLKDSSDEVIDIHEDIDDENFESFSPMEQLDDVLDERGSDTLEQKSNLEDDTLENDLFDLIDSMYENREEDK